MEHVGQFLAARCRSRYARSAPHRADRCRGGAARLPPDGSRPHRQMCLAVLGVAAAAIRPRQVVLIRAGGPARRTLVMARCAG